MLSAFGRPGEPIAVVPAGHWQAARATAGFALVGCTVGPGFEPDVFTLMKDRPDVVAALERRHRELVALVQETSSGSFTSTESRSSISSRSSSAAASTETAPDFRTIRPSRSSSKSAGT